MATLVCLQHVLTDEQFRTLPEGMVVTLQSANPELFARVANCPGDPAQIVSLAKEFAKFISSFNAVVLPIGSPAFQLRVGAELSYHAEINDSGEVWNSPDLLFADSERISEDQSQPDGSVRKVVIFRHKGWIKIRA